MRNIIKRQNTKGQAAMEFLMTYGWAILAAVIAIGVLAYFGVFNPSRLAGSTAVLNAPMNADAFNIIDSVAGADTINVEVTQNSGKTINMSATGGVITITSTAVNTVCTTAIAADSWASGTKTTMAFDCGTGAFAAGDSVAGDIVITYKVGATGLEQTSTGNIRGVAV